MDLESGVSHTHIQGENILNIRHMGRWSPTSKAIEPYIRVPFALLRPEKIYTHLPCYRCQWSPKRISYLGRLAVQTPNREGKHHPFFKAVSTLFPTFTADCPGTIPEAYPTHNVLKRMRQEELEGTYIKVGLAAAQARIQLSVYRKGVAAVE